MKTQSPSTTPLLEDGVAQHVDALDWSSHSSPSSSSQLLLVLGSQWHISRLTKHVLCIQQNGVSHLSSPTPKQNLTFLFQAPLFKDVQIKYHEQQFDGHFMEENEFRKNGSAEVDKAWESLGVDCMPHLSNYLVAALTKSI